MFSSSAAAKAVDRKLIKVQYWEEMANHSDLESCVAHHEVWIEALTWDTGGSAIEPRDHSIGVSMVLP